MLSTLIAAASLATLPLVYATAADGYQGDHYQGSDAPTGKVFVHNQCSDPYYMWPINMNYNPADDEYVYLEPGSVKEYDVIIPEKGCACGTSFKISSSPTKASAQTQMEYSLRDTGDRSTWCLSYDISLVDCSTMIAGATEDGFQTYAGTKCPGWEDGLFVYGDQGKNCGAMECAGADFCPYDVYFKDIPGLYQPVRQCDDGSVDADIHYVLCSGSTVSGGDPAKAGYKIPTLSLGAAPAPSSISSQVETAPASSAQAYQPIISLGIDLGDLVNNGVAPAATTTTPVVEAAPVESSTPPASITPAAVFAEGAASSPSVDEDFVYVTVLTTVEIYPNGERVYPRTMLA